MKSLLMGNEAIAWGALHAGVRVVSGYPGTPSTEILETIAREAQHRPEIHVEWSVNEKAALEVAAGAACAGARALVTMKQVGLNVASDPLMSLNYIGVKGGLVIAVADDPGPISSQTEQDTRHFGTYAKLAVFDPASPEEAYTMVADAFAYSERYGHPVILRPTTRICHSYASVELLEQTPPEQQPAFQRDNGRWVIFPSLAYRNHIKIENDLLHMAKDFSSYPGNALSGSGTKGIACGGVSYAYTREALLDITAEYKLLKVGTVPFPASLGLDFLNGLDQVLVIEELDPVIELELIALCGQHQLPVKIRGKRSSDMPFAGENTVALIAEQARAFLGVTAKTPPPDREINLTALPARPPVLCAGCPHRGSFFAVKTVIAEHKRKAVFSGDIGCYTLGNAPPLDMVDTCLCMGAGITMAQGINRAEPDTLNFAFIGDSTFFHTGIPGLINAVYNQANIIVIILDNFTTAMTGNQAHPGMGRSATGATVQKVSIVDMVKAIGVQDVARANPFDLPSAKAAVKGMLDKTGTRVIIFEAPCIMVQRGEKRCEINPQRCTACGLCVKRLGCPALSRSTASATIDPVLCTGCGLCKALCPLNAIS
ncbi:MAG: indolepyruvate ferredoxin oxidoreductase subunit alpha [Treponema sp.]|jgi:indolepyruvate ferredoxin oxidoreductase alpha subunit|nr:indolepyruvate ferredoxin oxidoreductase subunit alpha [Treponema sp.]